MSSNRGNTKAIYALLYEYAISAEKEVVLDNMAKNATMMERIEDNFDVLLVAILTLGFGTVTGNFGDFAVYLSDAATATFSMSGQFWATSGTTPTVISWGGALAIAAGALIFLTNLGIEHIANRPKGMEPMEYALALGVVGLPTVLELDLLNIHTDYVAGSPAVGLLFLGATVVGAIVLSFSDRS
ncbi:hypothetical protein I7X12_07795 [Halosimplex litoreum]|uniref:Uncharacterized protein n=1 Tax=Halosimplex litoreum TaxID=1198301 RepID=A0A7T3G1B6_9EURY|nr:hypothetical protein [Halosimplex litoreum]QPV64503.1 hypothetical protein I7X12_07795 [Halosimplex litoreum]